MEYIVGTLMALSSMLLLYAIIKEISRILDKVRMIQISFGELLEKQSQLIEITFRATHDPNAETRIGGE